MPSKSPSSKSQRFNLHCSKDELHNLNILAQKHNLPLSRYLVESGLSDSLRLSSHLQQHIEQIKFELGLLNHNVAALNDNYKLRELISDDQLNYLISYLSYSAKTLYDILSFQPNAAKKIFSPEAALDNFSKQHPGFDELGNISDLSPSSNPSSTNSSNQVNPLNKLSNSNESHQIPFDLFVALQFTTSKFSFFFSNENISNAPATNNSRSSIDDNLSSANTSEKLTPQSLFDKNSFGENLTSTQISPEIQSNNFVASQNLLSDNLDSNFSNQVNIPLSSNQSDHVQQNYLSLKPQPHHTIAQALDEGDSVSSNQIDVLSSSDAVSNEVQISNNDNCENQTMDQDDILNDDVDDVVSDEDDEDDFDEDDEFDLNDDRYDHLVPIDPPDFQGPYGDEDFDDSSIDPEENKKFMNRFMSLSKKEFRAYRDRIIFNFLGFANESEFINSISLFNKQKANNQVDCSSSEDSSNCSSDIDNNSNSDNSEFP